MSTNFDRFSERMPLWVAFGAALGICAGLFFGELMAPLEHVSELYAALMQIAAIPYLISSILHGLAGISREQFTRLIGWGVWVYGALVLVTFATIFVLTRALTVDSTPALVDLSGGVEASSLIERIIPINIFTDLTQNYLPALIVFSIIYGFAMQTTKEKKSFLEVLSLVKGASVTIWRWVVFLAPVAVFAVLAHIFGTMPFEDMVSLSAYLIAILLGSLVLGFVIIPGILEALYPGVMRAVWPDLRNGLIIAFTTSLSVAALPFIRRAVTRFLDEVGSRNASRDMMVESTLSLSYPLAQLGNFFIWIFVVFAAAYYRDSISHAEEAVLPLMVLLSGIGSPSTSVDAVAFLTRWLTLPDEAVALYSGVFSVTRYAQVMASVMGFLFVTVAVMLLCEGLVKFRFRRFAMFCIPGVAGLAISFGLIGALGDVADRPTFANYAEMTLAERVTVASGARDASAAGEHADAQARQSASSPTASDTAQTGRDSQGGAPSQAGILSAIQRRGYIRVGVNADIIPFSYRNAAGDLVGFDIESIQRLADDLNVGVRFVPFTWPRLNDILEANEVDVAAAGIYVTNERLENFILSEPYYTSPLALVVNSSRYNEFLTREQILQRPDTSVTVFNDPVMVEMAKNVLPGLPLKVVESYLTAEDLDLALWTQDQAWALALTRDDLTAVRPRNLGGTLLFAYVMPAGASALKEYINYWLRLQRDNGFNDYLVRKWIKADRDLNRPPRWSVLQNVLGVR